jgi:hypothetical protein
VSGRTIDCVGLIETFRFQGGEEDPIRITAYLSRDQAANVRAQLASPLSSTSMKIQWYILSFDEVAKCWYEAALIKDKAQVSANIDTTRGQVQMFIANSGTPISPTLDLHVYKFEFQIIPAAGAVATVEFATGATQRLVKNWGVEDTD